MRLATASFLRPNGKRIHRFAGADDFDDWGVKPDKGLEIALSDLIDDRQRDKTPRTDHADHKSVNDHKLGKLLEQLRGQLNTRRWLGRWLSVQSTPVSFRSGSGTGSEPSSASCICCDRQTRRRTGFEVTVPWK